MGQRIAALEAESVQAETSVRPTDTRQPMVQRWEERNGHRGCIVWFTGLSGSGKSAIAQGVMETLFGEGYCCVSLDGDELRNGICSDLGFSNRDRVENIRRVGEVAKLFLGQGAITICSCISPFRKERERLRSQLPWGRFFEVYIRCSLEECIHRDPKGLYKKALHGEIKDFTGISSPYEEPLTPELIIDTEYMDLEKSVKTIIDFLKKMNFIIS